MQRVFLVVVVLLLLYFVNYVELRKKDTPLRHRKNDKLKAQHHSLYKQHVSKRYKATRKSMKHDNDEERNITMLYDRVGTFPFQQHQQHVQQLHQQQQNKWGLSQKLYHHQGSQTKNLTVKKRPFISKTGSKRDFHSMSAKNEDLSSPSMSDLFTSSRALGTPLGLMNSPMGLVNSPLDGNTDGHLDGQEQEVPIGPLSSLMSGHGIPLPQPVQANLVGGSMPDAAPYITPHQTTFSSEANHLYQHGVFRKQGNKLVADIELSKSVKL